LWKGQQAFHSRPARMSFTVGEMTALSTVRARSSSSQAGESVTNLTLVATESPASRAADLSTAAEAERAREYLAKGRKPLISGDSFHARNEGF